MSTMDLMRELLDYTYWGHERIFATAAKVTQEQLDTPTWLDFSTIQGVLAHQLSSEIMLKQRIAGEPMEYIDPAEFTTLEGLKERWKVQESEMREIADKMTDEDLARVYSYTNRMGIELSESIQTTFFQLINHSTQHRSEVALALTQLGASPGGLDFVAYVRERRTD